MGKTYLTAKTQIKINYLKNQIFIAPSVNKTKKLRKKKKKFSKKRDKLTEL